MQQNSLTCSCAHAAIRTVLGRYSSNEMFSIDQIGPHKKFPNHDDLYQGLSKKEIITALEKTGIKCFVGTYDNTTEPEWPAPFQKWIYGSIESGYPALVGFDTHTQDNFGHIMPIFGHTFDRNIWVHRAENLYFSPEVEKKYISSESWVSMYVGHDTNWGSNYCIPRDFMKTKRICNRFPGTVELCTKQSRNVNFVLSTFPSGVNLSPVHAEAISSFFLFNILNNLPESDNLWIQRFAHYAQISQLILRPVLISNVEYARHLKGIKGKVKDEKINPEIITALEEELKCDWLWNIEISVPELYSATQRKIGEIILKATDKVIPENFDDCFLIARIPDFFVVAEEKDGNYRFDFLPSGIPSHTEIYSQGKTEFFGN